jgi:acyl dehydratase
MAITESSLPALTRQQIARYAGAVRDFNPIHVDEEFAKASGMPSAIAHGPLTLARALDAIDARLKAPYFPGQTMTVTPTDGGVELRDGSGTVLASVNVTLAD